MLTGFLFTQPRSRRCPGTHRGNEWVGRDVGPGKASVKNGALMNFQVVGWSHHQTPLQLRERLAYSPVQAARSLEIFRARFPNQEAVLLSTCNRVELYTASQGSPPVSAEELRLFLLADRQVPVNELLATSYHYMQHEAIKHLFMVAASLDSMVVGEPQILAQVKQAYQLANEMTTTGPVTHTAFQAALRVARRIATETAIHQRRVSIPSVAVADFARQIFERFDDKNTLVVGAGEMAEETLRYLDEFGVRHITVVNRHYDRAVELAQRWLGRPQPWEKLAEAILEADLVISTTSAEEPIITVDEFMRLERLRTPKPLFILDLAVPRNFDPAIGRRPGVYLYSIEDLNEACERNRKARDRELPIALKIIEAETTQFFADHFLRQTGPVIQRLRSEWEQLKQEELERLFNKLSSLDQSARDEIQKSFDRLVNKLLHPPLESLRNESRKGFPATLLDALVKLFQLKD